MPLLLCLPHHQQPQHRWMQQSKMKVGVEIEGVVSVAAQENVASC